MLNESINRMHQAIIDTFELLFEQMICENRHLANGYFHQFTLIEICK